MATLLRRTRGGSVSHEIQWYDGKKRKTVPLGKKYTERTANEVKNIVEILLYSKDNSLTMLDKRTLTWLESAPPEIRAKLVKAGLIEVPPERTTRELWDAFLKQKTDIKQATRDGYDYAEQRFFSFFKENELITDLTQERFEDWKVFLQKDFRSTRTKNSLVESTVAGTVVKTKAVLNWAVKKKKWLAKSPLDDVGRGSFINKKKDRFVRMDEYRRLLDACPCQDWRCIIALARIGGLRAPSEVLRLRWTDVNWEKNRFYVTSSKTERYKGHEGRTVPLWSVLREELERQYFAQPEGTEFVITRYRDPERSNLGTQFARIVQIAGIVEEIKRPFDNLRASRSNEVYASDGPFLESQWIGHSHKIARDHYLQVREEDFERTLGPQQQEKKTPKSGFPAVDKNLPAEFPAAEGRTKPHEAEDKKREGAVNH